VKWPLVEKKELDWNFCFLRQIIVNYYMANIISGKMADYDWLRSTFGPLRKNKRMHFKTKPQN
jgi:hypothetical protein